MPQLTRLREQMVRDQIERRGVRDPRVLAAMRAVPRHAFVTADQVWVAYEDRALPIAGGQTISQPYMVAVMTEALGVGADARVLEIGTGSGYQAAVLAELTREVTTIERRPELAESARRVLGLLGYGHVVVVVGDGTLGYPPAAPYDGIIVTAGAPHAPARLREQLADGGRLVVPVGPRSHQELLVVERQGTTLVESRRDGCVFVPLIGHDGWTVDDS